MGKIKWIVVFALITCLVVSILSYELLFAQSPNNNYPSSNGTGQTTPTPTTTVNPTNNPTNDATTTTNPTSTTNQNNNPSVTTNPTSSPTSTPTVEQIVEHEKDHEDSTDYIWNNSEVINIALNSNYIVSSSPNATADGNRVTINSAGNYRIAGTLADGQVIVNTQDEGAVRLILSNIDISSSSSAPIYVLNAKKTIIILEEGTQNTVRDINASSTVEPNAAVFSTSDLTIYGSGQLYVVGNNNDAISSKDGLIIKSGTITVTSLDDGIRGKDYLIIKDGKIIITAGGDGLKSDNFGDLSRGYISIENGVITITSGMDAIEAQSDVTITGGQITITSGGGSSSYSSTSTKGIKAINSLIVNSGNFTINSADDALHSNKTLIINGGTFNIQTGDDGMHADKTLIINNGTIDITKSFEGIESANVTINQGIIHINSSDDGINGAGGNDGSGIQPGPGGFGPGTFAIGNYTFYINGGYIVITAAGDGVDINGAIVMTSGTIIINGPTANNNSAIDYDSTFKITGGFILGVGSSGMAMTPSTTSTQRSILLNLQTTRAAGTLIHIETNTGDNILTFKTSKVFQSISLSAPTLTQGTTYNVYVGGNSTGILKDGTYQNGVYTPGIKLTTFTITSIVTKLTNL